MYADVLWENSPLLLWKKIKRYLTKGARGQRRQAFHVHKQAGMKSSFSSHQLKSFGVTNFHHSQACVGDQGAYNGRKLKVNSPEVHKVACRSSKITVPAVPLQDNIPGPEQLCIHIIGIHIIGISIDWVFLVINCLISV